jgi:hypothetical protein
MAGGSLGLTTASAGGLDLTNIRPQVTFFKKVFKRHTNFGIESIRQSNISGTPGFGNTITVTIDKIASLITDMHMEFSLPRVAGSSLAAGGRSTTDGVLNGVTGVTKIADWVDAVGFAIINNIELIIDQNTVDKHTGLWFDIWNELTDVNRKEWPLVGKRDALPGILDTPTRYYVPLKFFFNRNPGLALPIFLISDNKVKIKITFNSLISLIMVDSGPTISVNSQLMTNFKFFTTYIFLEADEESRIQNTLPAEYLIETLRRVGPITSVSNISNLLFENPTKEFIWVFRHNDRITSASETDGVLKPQPKNNSNKGQTNNMIYLIILE